MRPVCTVCTHSGILTPPPLPPSRLSRRPLRATVFAPGAVPVPRPAGIAVPAHGPARATVLDLEPVPAAHLVRTLALVAASLVWAALVFTSAARAALVAASLV